MTSSASAFALTGPLAPVEVESLAQKPEEICTTVTLRRIQEIFPFSDAENSGEPDSNSHPARLLSIEDGEILCVVLISTTDDDRELQLTEPGDAPQLIVALERQPGGEFSVLRLHNLSGETIQSRRGLPSVESDPSEWSTLGPEDEHHHLLPQAPRSVLLQLELEEQEVPDKPAPPVATPAEPTSSVYLAPHASSPGYFGAGFRLAYSFGYALRPRGQAASFLRENGYDPFPFHLTRVGGAAAVTFESSFLETALHFGAATAPHRTDPDRAVQLWETDFRLELGYEVRRFGGLSIYPYGGLGVSGQDWLDESSYHLLLDNPPDAEFSIDTFGTFVTAGIGFGQMIVATEEGATQTGFTFDLRLGVQQQIARTGWGFTAAGEEGRQTLGKDPRFNFSAFILNFSVGAGQRAAKGGN